MNSSRPPSALQAEVTQLIRLAVPVAIAQMGMLTMGLVDTLMVGRLGRVELAAVGLADASYFVFGVMAMWLIRGIDPLISQAYGAGEPERCAAAWRVGRRLALTLTLPMAAIVLALCPALEHLLLMDAEVVHKAEEYLLPRALGILPWLLLTADRALLHGIGIARPAMVVTLAANVVNAIFDWLLIFGMWGFPALGVAGAGYTTAIARWFMFLALAWWVYRPEFAAYRQKVKPTLALFKQTLRLGIPLALTQGLEVGAFTGASLFMGWLGVVALASHQIAIKMAALSFMGALALATATSIRVGQAIGAGRSEDAARVGRVGLGVGFLSMCGSALLFLLLGHEIMSCFTADEAVIALGVQLLVVAAAFQLSDGTQAIAAGALRGRGETAWPFWANLGGHYLIGLPLGAYLAFGLGYGPVAVWWALAAGLTVVAVVLVTHLRRRGPVRALHEAEVGTTRAETPPLSSPGSS